MARDMYVVLHACIFLQFKIYIIGIHAVLAWFHSGINNFLLWCFASSNYSIYNIRVLEVQTTLTELYSYLTLRGQGLHKNIV